MFKKGERWARRATRPNHARRQDEEDARKRAAEEHRKAEAQATQDRAAALARKNEELARLANGAQAARDTTMANFQTTLNSAGAQWQGAEAEYQTVLGELVQFRATITARIQQRYAEERTKILAAQAQDEAQLADCLAEAATRALSAKITYGQEIKEIDILWSQVHREMLHDKCISVYAQLKGTDCDPSLKPKHLSLLLAYLRLLFTSQAIDANARDRYAGFLHALATSTTLSHIDKNYIEVDSQLSALLYASKAHVTNGIKSADANDRANSSKRHTSAMLSNKGLMRKHNEIKHEIASKYSASLVELERWQTLRVAEVDTTYNTGVANVSTQRQTLLDRHNNVINNLNSERDQRIGEINNQEAQGRKTIEDGHNADLTNINTVLQRRQQEIDGALSETLKNIKRSFWAMVANAATVVVAGAAAFFTEGILAGASAWVIETVQTSLGLTSLGALGRLINGDDRVGFNFRAKIGSTPPSTYTTMPSQNHTAQQNTQTTHANMDEIRRSIEAINMRVEGWQSQNEHDLFYTINGNVGLPGTDFSDVLVSATRGRANTKYGVQLRLGGLQDNGFRVVDFALSVNNRNAFYTCLARDSDIRSVLHEITGVTQEQLGNNWQQPQALSFETTAANLAKLQAGNRKQPQRIQDASCEQVLNFIIPSARASETQQLVVDNSQATRFRLKSVLPKTSNNRVLAHLFSFGRGIEEGRDLVVDSVLHPIRTATDLVVTIGDGLNAITDTAFGISTSGASRRNNERGRAVMQVMDAFSAGDSEQKIEMLSTVVTSCILSAAVGNAPRALITQFKVARGTAIATKYGFAYQGTSDAERSALRQAKAGAIYRAVSGRSNMQRNQNPQFWTLEPPPSSVSGDATFAIRHAIPPENAFQMNAVQIGAIRPGAKLITRKIRPYRQNQGGGIEIVVEQGGVKVTEHASTLPPQTIGNRSNFAQITDETIQTVASDSVLGTAYAVMPKYKQE